MTTTAALTCLEQGNKNEQVKLLCEHVLDGTYYEDYRKLRQDLQREEDDENVTLDYPLIYPVSYAPHSASSADADWKMIYERDCEEEPFDPFYYWNSVMMLLTDSGTDYLISHDKSENDILVTVVLPGEKGKRLPAYATIDVHDSVNPVPMLICYALLLALESVSIPGPGNMFILSADTDSPV